MIKSEREKLPDFGTCEIEDWDTFLVQSKDEFDEKWNKPLGCDEDLTSFNQVKRIGSGAFGHVILIKHKEDARSYAMKAIEKEKIIKCKLLDSVKNEKMILNSLNFPFTVYLIHSFKDNSYIYLVMPYIDGGDLFNQLTTAGRFIEEYSRFYISQVVLALEYLHYMNLIYRDLKPENILLDRHGYVKITDFGHCKPMTNKRRTYTLCGTPDYLAPEVILSLGYGKSVDWWEVGVLTFELNEGKAPFCANDQMKTFERIINLKYKMPSNFSVELQDLVKNLLQKDTSRRYGNLRNGIDDIKYHKWFRNTDWMAILNRKMRAPIQPILKNETRNLGTKDNWLLPKKLAKEDEYPGQFEDF